MAMHCTLYFKIGLVRASLPLNLTTRKPVQGDDVEFVYIQDVLEENIILSRIHRLAPALHSCDSRMYALYKERANSFADLSDSSTLANVLQTNGSIKLQR
ncbi:hypothetical protein KIN20_020007 [Parelaphostrongylus tenuis]|uniref:Uncharacterized protein n=1 Tax=Parelaphostrongylus tenuis TaxID=148309 RepID=A0AAD5MLZ2_PARTN|nr:hypothetical protein KIN20_020007 [Parelaphostrongylus tenuis]